MNAGPLLLFTEVMKPRYNIAGSNLPIKHAEYTSYILNLSMQLNLEQPGRMVKHNVFWIIRQHVYKAFGTN
jgi:hypothetical protein